MRGNDVCDKCRRFYVIRGTDELEIDPDWPVRGDEFQRVRCRGGCLPDESAPVFIQGQGAMLGPPRRPR